VVRPARAEPIRVYENSPQLATTIRRTVAYCAVHACGWRGPSRSTYREARGDAARHTRTCGRSVD
jgi:hypothetical protein